MQERSLHYAVFQGSGEGLVNANPKTIYRLLLFQKQSVVDENHVESILCKRFQSTRAEMEVFILTSYLLGLCVYDKFAIQFLCR